MKREREREGRDAYKHGAVVKLIFGLMLMHSLMGMERDMKRAMERSTWGNLK